MKIDGKFFGEIYKNKDGSKVPEDQWIVFLAKDNAVPPMLTFYLAACMEIGADSHHINAVSALKDRVRKWREENPELCKIPDTEVDEIFKPQGG